MKIAGITPHPHEAWMVQVARNLTEAEEPFPTAHTVLDHGADRADPTAAAFTQLERVCGEIRALSEDGVYRADGLLQQIIA